MGHFERPDRPPPPGRLFLAGLLGAPALLVAFSVATVPWWPDWPLLRSLARVLEGALPHLAVAGLLLAAGLAALRAPRAAVWLVAGGCLFGLAAGTLRHAALSAPLAPDRRADLTVLWFNVLADTRTPPDTLAEAIAASPADIVVLGEAMPLLQVRDRLARDFPHGAGCEDGERCDLLVLSRRPLQDLSIRPIGRTREQRLAAMTVALPGRQPLSLIGAHLMKPWYYGITEGEEWQVVHALRDRGGPVVLIGDLNAAPWSRRLEFLADRCALRLPRVPPATWPAAAGMFGVPIDHVLVRGGARLVSLDTWGAGLGSNHLGLLARLSLPGAGAPPAPPAADCRPPRVRWDASLRN